MKSQRNLSLKTLDGAKKLCIIFIVLILLFSFVARLIMTDFGKVKIEGFNIDMRGANLNGEMFYPRGTSSDDKLPCVIVVHGTGCTYGVVRHFASEMARRGFVAMAISCYGAGLSDQPLYDELGHGEDIGNGFAYGNTTSGMLDAVNYARSLSFVDPTRIGVSGHSMGARISQCTAIADCGFYTFNDIMINVLKDTFGQTFTEDEINMDAQELAKARLSPEQLDLYNYISQEKAEYCNTRIRAIFPMGNNLQLTSKLETVNVGGYDVERGLRVNLGALNGEYDYGGAGFVTGEAAKAAWYTGNEDIVMGQWYTLDDVTKTSEKLGDFSQISIASNAALADAIDARSTRVGVLTKETHSKNFFSLQATARFIEFFQQTLDYSNGSISKGAVPMASSNQLWHIARIFNFAALLSMLGMVFALLVILLNQKFFASYVPQAAERTAPFNKKKYWIFAAATVVLTIIACYYGNTKIMIPNNAYFQLSFLSGPVLYFIIVISIFSLAGLVVNCILTKKETGNYALESLNLKMNLVQILKSILIAALLISAAYISLMVIEYLFKEDYRFWMTILTEMKIENWWIAAKYALLLVIPYLLIGAAINYGIRTDIPEWKDTLITIIVNSLGVWILCALTGIINRTSHVAISNFIVSFQLCICVPITVFISRKMYKLTNNLWVGAVFNSLFVAWSMTSELGVHTSYVGQNLLSILFNI